MTQKHTGFLMVIIIPQILGKCSALRAPISTKINTNDFSAKNVRSVHFLGVRVQHPTKQIDKSRHVVRDCKML